MVKKNIWLLLLLFVVMSYDNVNATLKDTVTVPTGSKPVTFQKSLFASGGQNPVLCVAALNDKHEADENRDVFALSRLVITEGDENGVKAQIQSLMPKDGVIVNGGEAGDNPLHGKKVAHLALMANQFPVVVTGDKETDAQALAVSVITDPEKGLTQTTLATDGKIKDAAKGDIDTSIVGVGASDKFIFAVVPAVGKEFDAVDGVGRGIAVLERVTNAETNKESLVQRDVTNIKNDGGARAIDVQAMTQHMAFRDAVGEGNITNALIGKDTAVWWDDTLQRLYVGFSDMRRDKATNAGGVLGAVMGYFDKNADTTKGDAFVLKPIVRDPQAKMFYHDADGAMAGKETRNVNDRMIGFYYDGKNPKQDMKFAHHGFDEISVSIRNVQTMHTSTGKPYLIVNSVMASNPVMVGGVIFTDAEDWVYALPLIPDALNGETDTKGVIAKVNKDSGIPTFEVLAKKAAKAYALPAEFNDMPTVNHAPVNVGGKNPVPASWVKDLFVAGDSVYVALAGFNNKNVGIFKSTALLNEDGFISSWTPAERVMGSVTKVFGSGLDTKKGNFYFLSTAGDNDPTKSGAVNTGHITQWGKSQKALHGDDDTYTLSSVLADIFPADKGGVHQIFSFDERTPGLFEGKISLMVAVGLDSVALIQAGAVADGEFTPTQKFIKYPAADANVFVFSSPVLKEIGPLVSAEIMKEINNVNVYVGGFGGIARLQLMPAAPATVISRLYAGVIGGREFTRIAGDIKAPVAELARGNGQLHVLTTTALYTRMLDGKEVVNIGPIAIPQGADVVVAVADKAVQPVGIIGTGKGLQTTNDFKVATAIAKNVSGHVLQLQYFSQGSAKIAAAKDTGIPLLPGMLYALVLGKKQDLSTDQTGAAAAAQSNELVPQIYRFSVSNVGVLEPIEKRIVKVRGLDTVLPSPFLQLKDFRTNFATDGTLLFNTLPKDSGNTDFVRVTALAATNEKMLEDEQSLIEDLDLDVSENFNVGVIVRDAASGAWVVPGDWGVRVNE